MSGTVMNNGNSSNNFASFSMYNGLLVHIKFGKVSPTSEQFETFLNDLLKVLQNQKQFTLFVDASEMGHVPFSFTLVAAMFLRNHRALFEQYCLASSVFITSAMVRGLLNAVFTLQPPVSPNMIVANASEGMQFLEQYMTPIITGA